MTSLRLMTYNVRYFGHGTRGMMSTRRGLTRIARSVASMQPLVDVLCLQEVEGRSLRSSMVTRRRATTLQALAQELDQALDEQGTAERYRARYFPAHCYRLSRRLNLYSTGLAILVRSGIEIRADNSGAVADITHRRGAKALKQTRICAHVSLDVDGVGRLDVFNTHMSLPGPFYPEFWMRPERFGYGPNQVLEARRLVEAIAHRRSGEHVVLVGDFNSLPESPVDEMLREEAGLVDALADAKGLRGERLRAWSTAGFMKKRMNIDRIYSSPQVRWLDFEGSRPFDGHDGLRNRFAGLSDHVPLVGTLSLAP
jgi:endonuclease/exonuclease/phosphatase family metal-dependent hydrolase